MRPPSSSSRSPRRWSGCWRSRSTPPRPAGWPAGCGSPACPPRPRWTDFDFDAAAGVDRKLIDELATCRYLESATNVLLVGPTGHRQDAAGGRARTGRRPRRLPHLLHHRRRPGGPLPPRRDRRPLGHHHAVLRRPDPVGRSTSSGYLPLPRRGRLSAVSGCLATVSEELDRVDDQPGGRVVGRDPRRHHRRRRHARSPAAPLGGARPRRRVLPAARPPRRRRNPT